MYIKKKGHKVIIMTFALLVCLLFAFAASGCAAFVGKTKIIRSTSSINTDFNFNKRIPNTNIPNITAIPDTTTGTMTSNNPNARTPAQTNSPSSSVQDIERAVVTLVNKARSENGLSELKLNEELSNVARTKSNDMATNNYFSHTSPTYGSPFDMMKKFGISYRTAGENIAKGQTTAQQVFDSWMNSPGHRANILNSSFTQIGVGYAANGHYWTQMFIG